LSELSPDAAAPGWNDNREDRDNPLFNIGQDWKESLRGRAAWFWHPLQPRLVFWCAL